MRQENNHLKGEVNKNSISLEKGCGSQCSLIRRTLSPTLF